jgi:hypothetical protein
MNAKVSRSLRCARLLLLVLLPACASSSATPPVAEAEGGAGGTPSRGGGGGTKGGAGGVSATGGMSATGGTSAPGGMSAAGGAPGPDAGATTAPDAGTPDVPAVSTPSGTCAELFGKGAPSAWVSYGPDGKLVYKPIDERGDRIMDFSWAGYRGGGVALPQAPVVQMVKPSGGDDTAAIQAAIDAVAKMPLHDGLRGAVLLAPGQYKAGGTITISASGVVLRGSGSGDGGTDITVVGSHVVFRVAGTGSAQVTGPRATLVDDYVPAGARSFTVDTGAGFAVGDPVLITRPVTAAWRTFMGMDAFPGWSGFTYSWERSITAIDGNKVTIDVPLPDSFDGKYVKPPGASMQKYTWDGRISQVGIESLRFRAPKRGTGGSPQFLDMNHTVDSWIRDVEGWNTVEGLHMETGSRRITITKTRVLHEPSDSFTEAAPFDFDVSSSEILVDRSASKGGLKIMMYTTHYGLGPNVVLNFDGDGMRSHIQPHMNWATGLLIDNAVVNSEGTQLESAIGLINRGHAGSDHGWAIGWAVAWNCTAPSILLQKPPGSMLWAIGCKTTPSAPAPAAKTTAPLLPDGIFESVNMPVAPTSLYLAQLCERLGPQALANIGY